MLAYPGSCGKDAVCLLFVFLRLTFHRAVLAYVTSEGKQSYGRHMCNVVDELTG